VATANKQTAVKPGASTKKTVAKAVAGTRAATARKTPAKTTAKTTSAGRVAAPSKKVAAKPAAKPTLARATATKTAPAKKPASRQVASAASAKNAAASAKAAPKNTAAKTAAAKPAAKPAARTIPQTAAKLAKPAAAQKPSGKPMSATKKSATAAAKKSTGKASNVDVISEAALLKMPEKDYMNDAQLAFFRHRLQTMREEILNNARETGEHLKENEVFADPNDRATVEEENMLEQRVRDRERKLLKKIDASLRRIDTGEYGFCLETGEPIGIGRLLARPTAELSIEAQEKHERLEKLYAD